MSGRGESKSDAVSLRRMKETEFTAWLAVVSAVAGYVLVAFFQWTLFKLLWVLAAVFPLAVAALFVVAIVACVNDLRRRFPVERWRAMFPAAFLVISLVALPLIDFTSLWLRVNFARHRQAREEVVRLISTGALPSSDAVELPPRLAAASTEGAVWVHRAPGKTLILFYTFSGIPDGFAGFVYSANGAKPARSDFNGSVVHVEQWSDRWFYIGAS